MCRSTSRDNNYDHYAHNVYDSDYADHDDYNYNFLDNFYKFHYNYTDTNR